jgi:alcohol dehydrogenase (NADP+)
VSEAKLTPTADAVDPVRVPKRTLANGAQMPAVGMGTFGSDKYDGETVAAAVIEAATLGYRHFDCASVYGNESLIGRALEKVQQGGVPRDELWVTSKVWNDSHGDGDVVRACKQSLQDLGSTIWTSISCTGRSPTFTPKAARATTTTRTPVRTSTRST